MSDEVPLSARTHYLRQLSGPMRRLTLECKAATPCGIDAWCGIDADFTAVHRYRDADVHTALAGLLG